MVIAGGAGPEEDGTDRTVVAALVAQMDRTPDQLAVRGEDGALTYAELDEASSRLVHALDRIDPGHRCPYAGVLLPHGVAAVVGQVAATRSGRTIVPLDVHSPPDRTAGLCAQVGPMVVLTHVADGRLVPPDRPRVAVDDLPGGLPTGRPTARVGPDAPFAVSFTSGSTGWPKAAVRTHRAECYSIEWERTEKSCEPGIRVGQVFEHTFAAHRTMLWGALGNGASLHLRDVRAHGPVGLARWLLDERINQLSVPASLIEAMLEQDPPDAVLAELQRVQFVGDVLRTETVRQLWPHLGPDAEIENRYGSSEMGGVARFRFRRDTRLDGPVVPAGIIIDHVVVRIARPDDHGLGEIEVHSPMLSAGYLDDTTDERMSFRTEGARRWFQSGDLGRVRPDGLLELHGRLDDRVKIRGQAVDPAEVERAVLGLAGVQEAVVVARTVVDTYRLIAYVVPAPGSVLTVTSVRRGLRDRVPTWMIPQSVVVLDALPRLTRGKVDRSALVLPGPERPSLEVAYAAPTSPVEAEVVEVFERVLGVNGVGRHDEFLDLGGDSLAAAEVVARLAAVLRRDLPLDAFHQTATPAAVTERLLAERQTDSDRLVVLQSEGDGTPVVCVHSGHGFVITLGRLAATTSGVRPFLGIQMLPTDPARMLLSVPGLARRYADLLDERLPGPCFVAGYSGGGTLAHALADELVRRGRPVAGCLLLDPAGPGRYRRLRWQERVYALHALSGLRPAARRVTQQRMAVSEVAARRYRGQPLRAPVVIFCAVVASPERWTPLAGAGLDVLDVPGDHEAMLHPPHVAVLGQRMEEAIQRLAARSPSASAASAEA